MREEIKDLSMAELREIVDKICADSESLDKEIRVGFQLYSLAKTIASKAEQAVETLFCLSVRDRNEQEFKDLYNFAVSYGKVLNVKAIAESTEDEDIINKAINRGETNFVQFPTRYVTLGKTEQEIEEFEKKAPAICEKFEQVFAEYAKSNGNNL